MAKAPKLANIEKLDDFSHWLADTVQRQVSGENAGFVQIERGRPALNDVTIRPGGGVVFVLRISQEEDK